MPARIRPNRTTHREWFSKLDADSKATVRSNVEALIAEGLAQPEAWAKVYDSDQQPATQHTSTEGPISDHEPEVEAEVEPLVDDKLVEAEQQPAATVEPEPAIDVPKGARAITTKTGKLPEHLTKALGSLSSVVDPSTGTLYVVRGEQQKVVDALRTYAGPSTRAVDGNVPPHVAWTIESVIGKVRSVFHRVVDKHGDNVNVRAIDAMVERDVQFEVVMRSDGSPMFKVGDVTMSAREALKQHSDLEAKAS